ncbi:serine hydrolase domain-containing protein [Alkalihalobacterium chitinilyticum]|uniref:Beta-lactamase family protein n=1 Tax=Alkalihalobacterium chitinilyticum TaxID=2980103 RepID=A0ABT5VGG6_9BACI|nr:serine hydrolase [Alkalihalobacterium chitinilyticum]MDE5414551.1 beta-lactamase family protein [Alkalihalobacterium chitinilyticum]
MLGKKKWPIIILSGIFFTFIYTLTSSKNSTPTITHSTWKQYETPEHAGWSSERLEEAKRYYDSLGSTAAMVIYDGKVLVSWGDTTRKSNIHSVRKSFLSALYGIHVHEGNINIQSTLKELDIIDNVQLTEQEQTAKIVDLLTSRSGVFLTAGEESLWMRWTRPDRGLHLPGTHFYYNNWDFNVLGTIFKEKTNTDLFTEFKERIAIPIGMEDYTTDDTSYKLEVNRSIHPSYLFRMSARDMARFGQLVLQNGVWEGEQIIPKQWIKESTTVHTSVPGTEQYGYGYMWWIADTGEFSDLGLYSAIGRYGQSIDIIPEKNLVFVHRVNSDNILNRTIHQVSNKKRLTLLQKILDAQITG